MWERGKGRCDGGLLGYSLVNAILEAVGGEQTVILPGGVREDVLW